MNYFIQFEISREDGGWVNEAINCIEEAKDSVQSCLITFSDTPKDISDVEYAAFCWYVKAWFYPDESQEELERLTKEVYEHSAYRVRILQMNLI